MDPDEDECPRRDPTVPLDQPVLAHRPLEPGEPGDEHQHEQHEVGPGESGQTAAGDQQATGARSDPPLSPVMTRARVTPIPRPTEREEEVADPTPGHVARPGVRRGEARAPAQAGREASVPLFGGGHRAEVSRGRT